MEFQSDWESNFINESELLHKTLANLEPVIHHIGSTSVIGLAAKPIIDILVEVDDVKCIDAHGNEMSEIGYISKGEFGIAGRRYFQKGGENRTHQIHAFSKGDYNVTRHIAFRDYLRTHPVIATEYAELKKDVAVKSNNDIGNYCEGKNDFVQFHEKKAVEWYALNKSLKSDAKRRAL